MSYKFKTDFLRDLDRTVYYNNPIILKPDIFEEKKTGGSVLASFHHTTTSTLSYLISDVKFKPGLYINMAQIFDLDDAKSKANLCLLNRNIHLGREIDLTQYNFSYKFNVDIQKKIDRTGIDKKGMRMVGMSSEVILFPADYETILQNIEKGKITIIDFNCYSKEQAIISSIIKKIITHSDKTTSCNVEYARNIFGDKNDSGIIESNNESLDLFYISI